MLGVLVYYPIGFNPRRSPKDNNYLACFSAFLGTALARFGGLQ
jgi:hypothetical protein